MRELLLHPLPEQNGRHAGLLAELHELMRVATCRQTEVREERIAALRPITDCEVKEALNLFDPLWNPLTAKEPGRVLQPLVERVDYHGTDGKVVIAFHPAGLKALLNQTRTTPRRK